MTDYDDQYEKLLTLREAIPNHSVFCLTGTKKPRSFQGMTCPMCDNGRLFIVENGAGCMDCRTVIVLHASSIEVERRMVEWGWMGQHHEPDGPFRITSVAP